MSKDVLFSKKFTKHYRKLTPEVQSRFTTQLVLWRKDPLNRKLNHVLTRNLASYHSVTVGGDLRVLSKEYGGGKVVFERIGPHAQLVGVVLKYSRYQIKMLVLRP